MDAKLIKIMPPLDHVINEIYERLQAVEKNLELTGSRLTEIDKYLATLDEKIRRIEKYAK